MPSRSAADLERSMTRFLANGPLSLIRTSTERPLSRFCTQTWVPSGSERWAAVMSLGCIGSPLAVFPFREYQEARPTSGLCGFLVSFSVRETGGRIEEECVSWPSSGMLIFIQKAKPTNKQSIMSVAAATKALLKITRALLRILDCLQL